MRDYFWNPVSFVSLTVGDSVVEGPPPPRDSGGQTSRILLRQHNVFPDYDAAIALPVASRFMSLRVFLSNENETVFPDEGVMPLSLPEPLVEVFPDLHEIHIDIPGLSRSCLAGIIGEPGPPSMTSVRGNFSVDPDTSPITLNFIVDKARFGSGEIAIGIISDPGGDVMGVEPSPFRIMLETYSSILGELDFSAVTGRLGSLHLEGVRIRLPDGSSLEVAEQVALDRQVQIDIKPDSADNVVQLSSSGVIPVAILSSPVFDATEIAPGSVTLAGARASIS